MTNRAEESGRGCRILRVSGGGFLLVTSAFLTEHLTAEILARFHTGQHAVDFGRVLMSFLSDLAFGPVSKVISSQQLLCVPAPSLVKSPGEFTPSAVLECKLEVQCFVLGAKSFGARAGEKPELYLKEHTKSLGSWSAGSWFLPAA